ncbi:MAG: 30S ribosomal protein S20 [Candidatus Ancillula sp.]|jgi:small subunit ribosomal protein S20|nr:30S ribosomal protein S20 [Candidatus Ancillula sp.]
MANIKSQKKRVITNEKAHKRNVAYKSELKTLIRKTREAVAVGELDAASASLKAANRKLDIAVSKGVIHKNNAANRKSAIASIVNKLSA